MASRNQAAPTQGTYNGYGYSMASQTQSHSTQRNARAYTSCTDPTTSQTQSASAQAHSGNYSGNSAYYADTQNDQAFQHIGAWAPRVPYGAYSANAQSGDAGWDLVQQPVLSQSAGRNTDQAQQTSFQMERFLSQQPKQDPWSYVSRGLGKQ